jgi:hypothetical protein
LTNGKRNDEEKEKKMGQYHKLINLDKHEVVEPYGLGLGAKQYEQTGTEASLGDAIYLLVMTSPASGGGDWPQTDVSGRWAGDRVVVLGDYTSAEALPEADKADKLYSESSTWEDITPKVREAFSEIFQARYNEKEYGTFKSWERELLVS